MATDPLAVVPGHSLGCFTLGSSLQDVLSTVKEDKTRYSTIDLSFSQAKPLSAPVVVGLPQNGIRLRFDGSDQRLRLIEVLDPTKTKLAYKGSELAKRQDEPASFKRIYQLFGASYPGEYIQPAAGSRTGTYVLSWPGIAFNFPLLHSAWAPEKDHVSLLGSQAAQAATHVAVFDGNSWPEARGTLFQRTPSGPRCAAIASQPRDLLPAELEWASVEDGGKMSFIRSNALPFSLVLGQTTPQDLLTELGPPDTMHKRDSQTRLEQPGPDRRGSNARPMQNGFHHPTPPSSYGSTGTDTFETDFQDSGDADDDPSEKAGREVFWCYFRHGLDILVGPPSGDVPAEDGGVPPTPVSTSPHLVVLRVVIHGNVPGSYAFNRHRRLRWALDLRGTSSTLTSEHSFDEITPDLMQAFQGVRSEPEMARGKVVNRSWGGSPSDSSFFLPDSGHDLVESGGGSEEWIRNTFLHNLGGGLTFEVSSNGAITALTVS